MSQPADIRPHHLTIPSAAVSDAMGTLLPRTGVFWGISAPKHRPTVVVGDYSTQGADETFIRQWYEPNFYVAEPTSLANNQTGRAKLADFKVYLDDHYSNITASEISTRSSDHVGALPTFIRNFGAAYAFFSDSVSLTQSLSLKIREILAPLRIAPSISVPTESTASQATSPADRHAGLMAVTWLSGVLRLSRPTILRMAGVPESTFYSWQKKPSSAVRIQSVSRLLKLQAHLGLLAQVLGEEAMRNWVFSSTHLESLQGDDDTFERMLVRAQEETASTIRPRAAKRMKLEDYSDRPDRPIHDSVSLLSSWPGAEKLSEEQTD